MKVECYDCKGTGVIDPCPRCKGEGKIEHDCQGWRSLALVADIYGCNRKPGSMGGYESLGIYRCKICNQLWKIRFQFDQGTGSDHIWIRPGGAARQYAFPEEMAEMVAQILNAKSASELPEGLAAAENYIRRFAEERMEEFQK